MGVRVSPIWFHKKASDDDDDTYTENCRQEHVYEDDNDVGYDADAEDSVLA